ncbi:hypothetical protein Lal_00027019 [Lupinus albus]|nr:hypothetical protein Lal_00027019 [Lupinus albus]
MEVRGALTRTSIFKELSAEGLQVKADFENMRQCCICRKQQQQQGSSSSKQWHLQQYLKHQSYDDFNINPSNPYYLYSSENLTLVLGSPLLNDKKYHSWSRSIMVALQLKNTLKFIDQSLPQHLSTNPLYGTLDKI